MLEIIKSKHSRSKIKEKRLEIAENMNNISANIKNYTIKHITISDLEYLFDFYDTYFFSDWFKLFFAGKIKFSISKKLTKSAGIISYSRNLKNLKEKDMEFDIRMGYDFFLRYGDLYGDKIVNGIKTKNNLQAFQLVFEHEICHLVELITFKESSCKKARFKSIAHNLFGHIKSTHALPTYKEIAYRKYGIKVGDFVSFSFSGKMHFGKITRITKRATVMVKDSSGDFEDRFGTKYSKYYIPISDLNKIKI